MDNHINDFFCQNCDQSPRGNFHKVIALHAEPNITWEHVHSLIPNMCKGWYELAHLESEDRLQFICDFWISKLPFHPHLNDFLIKFFDSLDDIGIFLTQQKYDDPFEAHLVYSLKQNQGFFRGASPATEKNLLDLKYAFPNIIFPQDYLAFLQIHNGFSKTTDVTGIIAISDLLSSYQDFQALILEEGELLTTKGLPVNPKTLIPFYESFGMPFYQCFWGEWYPQEEMGNVYYSDLTKTISDVNAIDTCSESMAFNTFLDWLIFYMERID